MKARLLELGVDKTHVNFMSRIIQDHGPERMQEAIDAYNTIGKNVAIQKRVNLIRGILGENPQTRERMWSASHADPAVLSELRLAVHHLKIPLDVCLFGFQNGLSTSRELGVLKDTIERARQGESSHNTRGIHDYPQLARTYLLMPAEPESLAEPDEQRGVPKIHLELVRKAARETGKPIDAAIHAYQKAKGVKMNRAILLAMTKGILQESEELRDLIEAQSDPELRHAIRAAIHHRKILPETVFNALKRGVKPGSLSKAP